MGILDPQEKSLREMYLHYAPFIDSLAERLRRENDEQSLVGATSDETLKRVYAREGYRQALADLLSALRKNV